MIGCNMKEYEGIWMLYIGMWRNVEKKLLIKKKDKFQDKNWPSDWVRGLKLTFESVNEMRK